MIAEGAPEAGEPAGMEAEKAQVLAAEEAVGEAPAEGEAEDSTLASAPSTEAVVEGAPSAAEAEPATAAQAVATAEQPDAQASEGPAANGSGNSTAVDAEFSGPLSEPPYGTEVFVGGIPRSANETQIREFAEAMGEVHTVTLVKDPNNAQQNKGFGFVKYKARECAEAAKEKLHETELKDFPGNKVRVASSQSKHKLYIGNIPKAWSKPKLTEELNKHVRGLEGMDLVLSKDVEGENRGFAFLAFYNTECAAAAKDILSKSSFNLGGRTLSVSFAEPKNSDAQSTPVPTQKAVYVGKLPESANDEKLKALFESYGEVTKVVIPPAREGRPRQEFGFVHFADQAAAAKVVADAAAGNKPTLDGNTLEVKAARPQGPDPRQAGNTPGGYGAPGGRGPAAGRFAGRGTPGFSPRGRGGGRGGFAPRGRGNYGGYGQGYDDGYGGGYGGYDQGYDEGYGSFGAAVPLAAAAASPAGMTMVPMMLPSGQVGYVLQSAEAPAPAGGGYSGYSAGGPDRAYNGNYDSYGGGGGRGRGRRGGGQRYQPY